MGKVVALMDDLFFQMKLAETAKQLGVELKVATNGDALMGLMESHPKLVIVDLNARSHPVQTIEMLRLVRKDVRVVGFLDDNPNVRRRRVRGIVVLGALDEIATALESARPDEVLVTIPAADEAQVQTVIDACTAAGIACRLVHRHTETTVGGPLEVTVE